MNGALITLIATWILIAVLLIVQPWLTRRNVLFGVVFGDDEIWKDKRAKEIRAHYLTAMIAGTAIISLLFFASLLYEKLSVADDMIPYLAGIAALLVYGAVVFVVFHAKTISLKAAQGSDAELVKDRVSVETSLSDRQTVISAAWFLLLIPILLAAYGVAVFGFPFMPANLPVHYSFTAVDTWSPKSWATVLMPLVPGTISTACLFLCCLFTRRAPASVRGNPDAAPKAFRFRKYMIVLMIVLTLMAELSFLLTEIGFLVPLSPLIFEIPVVLDLVITAALFIVYFRFVRVKKPKGPILDDDSKWVLGMFYYNSSDPSAFIEKRTGIGYTLNFAKPVAWIFIGGVVAIVIASIVVSTH